MFYKWGGSDILSISTFNHYSRILKVVAVILLQKKNTGLFGNFSQRGGGGSPIPKTLSKFTKIPPKKWFFFEEQKCSLGSKMQNKH